MVLPEFLIWSKSLEYRCAKSCKRGQMISLRELRSSKKLPRQKMIHNKLRSMILNFLQITRFRARNNFRNKLRILSFTNVIPRCLMLNVLRSERSFRRWALDSQLKSELQLLSKRVQRLPRRISIDGMALPTNLALLMPFFKNLTVKLINFPLIKKTFLQSLILSLLRKN